MARSRPVHGRAQQRQQLKEDLVKANVRHVVRPPHYHVRDDSIFPVAGPREKGVFFERAEAVMAAQATARVLVGIHTTSFLDGTAKVEVMGGTKLWVEPCIKVDCEPESENFVVEQDMAHAPATNGHG